MNINELDERIKQEFTLEKGFGVVKLDVEGWKNIPFVVPTAPLRGK